MSGGDRHPPQWIVARPGQEGELRLAGDWIAGETGVRRAGEVRRMLGEIKAAVTRRFHMEINDQSLIGNRRGERKVSRVAIVTGGTRGIGAAISKALHAEGHKHAAS